MRFTNLTAIFFALFTFLPVFSGDIVSGLLKDSVATFSDSYDLIYYSVRSALAREGRQKGEAIQAEIKATNERIEGYLVSRGITLSRDRQPISRADFAKLVIKRFELPKGFFTDLLGGANWYFRDAVRAGLFSETDQSDGTMSTREMLSVFTRAEALSRHR